MSRFQQSVITNGMLPDIARKTREWLEANRPAKSLFWPQDDWLSVRERMLGHPVFPDAWPARQKTLDQAIETWNPEPVGASGYTVSQALQRPDPPGLALAYRLTDDARYLQTLEQVLAYDLAAPAWHFFNYTANHPGNSIDLQTGRLAREWGLALAWAGEALPAGQVSGMLARLCTDVFEPFIAAWPVAGECWLHFFTHNWPSVITGEIGIAALSMADCCKQAPEVVELCLRTILRTLSDKGEDGDWDEGPAYLAYGMTAACVLGYALYRASGGGLDLFAHPFIRHTGDFLLHATRPEGGVFNFSDCGSGSSDEASPGADLMGLLAARYRNPAYQWYAKTYGPPGTPEVLVFLDTELQPAPPDIPTAKHFYPTGTVTARSDWSEKAIYVGFRNRGTASRPYIMGAHQHLDLNSFVLSAYGEPLVIDPPAPDYTYHHNGTFLVPWLDSTGHSTLVFDGQGQQRNERLDYGQIRSYEAMEDWVHVVGCADGAYRHLNASSFRHLILVDNAYVLIVDYIGLDCNRHVTWNLPHIGKSEVTECSARIVRPNAVLDIRCLVDDRPVYPTRTTFPRTSRWNAGAVDGWNVEDTIEVLGFNLFFGEGVHLLPFVLFPLQSDETAPEIVEYAVTDNDFTATIQRNGITDSLYLGKHNFMFRYSRKS